MGKATVVCLYKEELISVEQALEIKNNSHHRKNQGHIFFCSECHEPVRPISERHDGVVAAHIQHVKVNPKCSLSPIPKGTGHNSAQSSSTANVEKSSFKSDHSPNAVLDLGPFYEGELNSFESFVYERNPEARAACLLHHGHSCYVCDFNFQSFYGEFARDFIHVHHLVPVHARKARYQVDPVKDLVPVCPNCHAAIHIGGETRSIDGLRALVKRK